MTYNIHKGIGGLDLRYRIERVIGAIAALEPDIVFLQEVDEGAPRSRRERQVDVIGEGLGLEHRAYHPNVQLMKGHYGNAVLSRFPFDHDENVDLTLPPKKRRGALHVRMTLDDGEQHLRLWLFNVHLGLSGIERRIQVRRLLRWLGRHHPRRDSGVVVAGDFNDVFGRLGPLFFEPAGFRGLPLPPPTYPAVGPVRALDRVYVRGALRITTHRRGRGRLAREASDHLPLAADLCVEDPAD